ncbi:hypothetical protein VB319_21415 [Vibrio parahaemolyticus]|uniref:hypothetical protein n=1 Tax=Vibrio parahaemolyticus TaxID=670 RepID=UPI002B20EAD5|nr:hypothetical protein [Vibrio parahaemolyticus]MCI4893951.1 hypothetical protein [Vibrio parahaemolyticus]MEA5356538.1 hypothetical protein [Vibrio parahaemolyticus]
MSEDKKGFLSRIFKRKNKRQEALVIDDSPTPDSLAVDDSNSDASTPDENSVINVSDEKHKKGFFAKKSKKQDKKKQTKEKEVVVSEPIEFYMGYYAKVTKKEVKEYLFNFASANVTPIDNAFYNIVSYGEGYLWEIHEGGSGRGALTSIIEELDDSDSVTIIKENFSLAVVKDEEKISVAKISAANLKYHKENKNIVFKDKMKKFTSSGYEFFVFSLIMLTASFILLGAAMVNRQDEKNRITNEHLYESRTKSPMLEISKLNRYMTNENSGVYVKDMRYVVATNTWKITTSPTPNYDSIKQNVIDRVTKKEETVEEVKDSIEDLENTIANTEPKKSKKDVLNKLAE